MFFKSDGFLTTPHVLFLLLESLIMQVQAACSDVRLLQMKKLNANHRTLIDQPWVVNCIFDLMTIQAKYYPSI